MNKFSPFSRSALAVSVALLSFLSQAEEMPDTLEQQAVTSKLAATSMLSAMDYAGDRIVAVGVKGHVLLSDDDGDNWRQSSQVPVTVTLTDVCFNGPSEGWAVGHRGAILKSVDGGEQWALQYDGVSAANDLHQALVDSNSENAFYGELMVEDGADKPFLAINCLGQQKAVAVGAYGLGFSTQDGGNNWKPSTELFDGSQQMHVYSVDKVGDRLLLAGERGLLFSAAQDLSDFRQLSSPYDGTYFGLIAKSNDRVVVFGLRGNAFTSADGGATWQAVAIDSNQNFTAGIKLQSGSYLLVDNAGRGWLSHDDAASFERITGDQTFPLTDLLELPNGDVIATGAGGFFSFDSGQLN